MDLYLSSVFLYITSIEPFLYFQESQKRHQQIVPLPPSSSPDLMAQAHRNMVMGRSDDSINSSTKKRTDSKTSLSTTLTDTTSSYPEKKGSTIYTETDTAYYSPSESGFSGSTHSFSTQQNRGETPNQKYVIFFTFTF